MVKVLNRKYRLMDKISDGGSSSVYKAQEMGKDAVLAIKLLHHPCSRVEDIIRFHQEADFLAGIRHPHIINIHERGVCTPEGFAVDPVHYLVMDYIDGHNLADFIDRNHPGQRQVLLIMEQIGRALAELHRNGFVHGDLKPENVMISEINQTLHVTLIDFALSRINHSRWSDHSTVTFHYMSPERSGMIKRPIDERSDLYSLGVIGYRLLTRQLPFQAKTLTELLHSQIAVQPELPSALNPSLLPMLDDIIMKLLEKEPSRRYQSADGLIHDLKKMQKGIHDFTPGEADRMPEPDYMPEITGRDRELERLFRLADTIDREDRICLLAGEAGVGKTKILEALGQHARKMGVLVLEGRCVERQHQTPWGLIQDILSDYMKVFHQYPDEKRAAIAGTVRKESGDLGSILIRLFPPTRLLLGNCPELLALDLEKDKLRSLHAVIRFLLALIHAEKRLVVMLEDLQWVDASSFAILKELFGSLSDSGVMVVGSYRSNAVAQGHPMHDLIGTVNSMKIGEVVTIAPLTRKQAERMISAIIRGETEHYNDLSDFIFEKSHGNPLYILEVVKSLYQKKVLMRREKRLLFDKERLNQVQIPPNLQDTILRRISLLDGMDIKILCDASILGRRFDVGILIELEKNNGISQNAVVPVLDRALAHRILEKDSAGAKGRLAFVHDRIREAFYRKIGRQKKSIHNSIGYLIESTYTPDEKSDVLFDLAYHFIEGDNEPKILQYVYPAGLSALNRYDYDLAVRYLSIVRNSLENEAKHRLDTDKGERWYQCSRKLGEALIMTGDNETGAALLTSLVPFSQNDLEKAGLYFQICSAYATRGDWQHCQKYGQAGLALLREHLPVGENEVKYHIARALGLYSLQTLLPRKILRAHKPEEVAKIALIMDFYNIFAISMLLQDKYKFLYASLRLLQISEIRMGTDEALSESYGQFSAFCIKIGFWKTASTYLEKAKGLALSAANDLIYARLGMFSGYFHQFKGEYRKSCEVFQKSIAIFDRIGDMGSSLHCRIGLIDTYAFRSEHDRIAELLGPVTRQVNKFGDSNGIAASIFKEAWLAFEKGDLDGAEKHALQCRDFSAAHNSLNHTCWTCALIGAICLEKGRADAAMPFLLEGIAIHKEKSVIGQYSVWNFILYAEALIRRRYVDPDISLKQIRRACKRAMAITKSWETYRGVSLRVFAMSLHLANRNRRAEKMFLKSSQILGGLNRKFELALSHREYGYFLRATGRHENALSQLNQAWRLFNEMDSAFEKRIKGYPGPGDISLKTAQQMIGARRADVLYKPAAGWAVFHDTKSMSGYVIEMSMKISGAQGGCLFLVDRETKLLHLEAKHHMSGYDYIDYSQGIVDQVHRTGISVTSIDACNDIQLPYKSVSLKQIKSVLCMPLFYEEQVSGVCYLYNQLSSGVFSREEETILREFLFVAALHIENLKLKRTIERIESRVPAGQPHHHPDKLGPVLDYIRAHYTSDISRGKIAGALGMDPMQLGKDFKASRGKSIKAFINELRLDHAYKLLLETDKKIIDIAYESGFESLRTFNRIFADAMGNTPSNYRKRHRLKQATIDRQ